MTKFRVCLFFIVALAASAVFGQDYVLIKKNGVCKLYQVNADASLTLLPGVVKMMEFDGQDPVTPDPITPDPVNLTPNGKKIRDGVLALSHSKRDEEAANLGELHRKLAELIDEGKVKIQESGDSANPGRDYSEITEAVRIGYQKVLRLSYSRWTPVRDDLADMLVEKIQEGANEAAFAKLLRETGDGLTAVSDKKSIDIAMILKIIEFIIEFIQTIRLN